MRIVYPIDDATRAIVPNLRGIIDVPACGHWTQQERPDIVTAVLLEFLRGLRPLGERPDARRCNGRLPSGWPD